MDEARSAELVAQLEAERAAARSRYVAAVEQYKAEGRTGDGNADPDVGPAFRATEQAGFNLLLARALEHPVVVELVNQVAVEAVADAATARINAMKEAWTYFATDPRYVHHDARTRLELFRNRHHAELRGMSDAEVITALGEAWEPSCDTANGTSEDAASHSEPCSTL